MTYFLIKVALLELQNPSRNKTFLVFIVLHALDNMWLLTLLGAVILVLLLCLIITYTIYLIYIHRQYSHIPGPREQGIIGFYLGPVSEVKRIMTEGRKNRTGGNITDVLYQWAVKYDGTFITFSLHKPIVFTADPAAIKASKKILGI